MWLFWYSKRTRKNGTRNGKQRYWCQSCHKQFEGGNRLNAEQLWQLYTQGKQTTEQPAKSFGRSRKTISRYLQKAQTESDFAVVQNANILMDTTYFGRQYGVMVLYDGISKQALFMEELRYESNVLYPEVIRSLQAKRIHIQSISYDGRQEGKRRRGAAKKVSGIKRYIAVESQALPHAVAATTAR